MLPFAMIAEIFAFAFSHTMACSRVVEESFLCLHYGLLLHGTGDTGAFK